MEVQNLSQAIDDLTLFNQDLEFRLASLQVEGLLSTEELGHLKDVASTYLQPVEQALTDSGEPAIAIADLVQQYKTEVDRHLAEVRMRPYSGQKLRHRMKEVIQSHLAEISARLKAEHQGMPVLKNVLAQINRVKDIKADIQSLESELLLQFKTEILTQGNEQRPVIFAETLTEFSQRLKTVIDRYFIGTAYEELFVANPANTGTLNAADTKAPPSAFLPMTAHPANAALAAAALEQTKLQIHDLLEQSAAIALHLQSLLEQSQQITQHLALLTERSESLTHQLTSLVQNSSDP